MWPAVKRGFSQEGFRRYVEPLVWNKWRPSKFVWHNTAAPTLAQWVTSGEKDRAKGQLPGTTRINNLETYFRVNNHWSGCPHLFIAPDLIWVMNPLTAPGVHSPSYNSTAIGIEMIGDFSVEDDEAGLGLLVKQNTIFATAILCAELGIEPNVFNILLHKEDRRTTHDCPGKNIAVDKFKMGESVAALLAGGEHDPDATAAIIAGSVPSTLTSETRGVTLADNLNFRTGPGVNNPSSGMLPKGVRVTILDQAMNGSTGWVRVKTPNGHVGWVAARFIQQEVV